MLHHNSLNLFRNDFGMNSKHLIFRKIMKYRKLVQISNTCLKLDVRTFLDAYNVLAYGETLSEQLGKHCVFVSENYREQSSRSTNKYRKTLISGRFSMPTTSWHTGKHFMKDLQKANNCRRTCYLFLENVTILTLTPI